MSVSGTDRQVSNEVEEEIAFGHADHFVENLDEQTETLTGLQFQSISDVSTEVFRSRGGIHFEGFRRIVGEIHLVIDLSGHVLNRFHFHLMGRVFPLTIPEGDRSSRQNHEQTAPLTSAFVAIEQSNRRRVDVFSNEGRDSLRAVERRWEQSIHLLATSVPSHAIRCPAEDCPSIV